MSPFFRGQGPGVPLSRSPMVLWSRSPAFVLLRPVTVTVTVTTSIILNVYWSWDDVTVVSPPASQAVERHPNQATKQAEFGVRCSSVTLREKDILGNKSHQKSQKVMS